jgi:hypothetical protein
VARRSPCIIAAVLAGLGVIGCGGEAVEEQATGTTASPADTTSSVPPTRVYERSIVFAAQDSDSTLVVPWVFTNEDLGTSVEREARGWLSRNGSWEAFFHERWSGPATRTPWRLLPMGPLRLVVGADEALEDVVYEEGPRVLEVGFGSLLAEWTSSSDQVFRMHEGSALLSGQRVEGVLLDINRSRPSGVVHGEWAFLSSGDSLHMVLDGVRPADVPLGGAFGSARLDFRQLQWNDLQIEWTELRAYERARREVPVAWRITTPDGSVEGVLQAMTTEIEAGEGSGPLLPVYALFEVEGEITVEGSTFPVRGLLRHTQS